MNESSSSTASQRIVPTPAEVQDLTGRTFGRWSVIGYSHAVPRISSGTPFHHFICECSCSAKTRKAVNMYSLLTDRSTSCGCKIKESRTKHGMSRGDHRHDLYSTWVAMRSRCRNNNNPSRSKYVERGITVDSRWESFDNFLADMLPTWKEGTSLDRKNNDGPYTKDNCRWVDALTQMNNTSRNRFIVYKGEKMTVAQLHRKMGAPIPYQTLLLRLNNGWPVENAIETPSGGKRPRFDQYTAPVSESSKRELSKYRLNRPPAKDAPISSPTENKIENTKKFLLCSHEEIKPTINKGNLLSGSVMPTDTESA